MTEDLAIEFIKSNGSEPEKARLQYLLYGTKPTSYAIAALAEGQQVDGGWSAHWNAGYSSLDATCYCLAQAEQMGLDKTDSIILRAVEFLKSRQRSDGSWEEDPRVGHLAPVWARPGDLSSRLYLTANCGWWIAYFEPGAEEALKASQHLQQHLYPDGRLPSFLHTHWLATALWQVNNHTAAAELAIRYLSRHLNDLSASNLAWMCLTLLLSGLSKDHPLIEEAVTRIRNQQCADGRWESEDGPDFDVHTTLEAMRVIRLCS